MLFRDFIPAVLALLVAAPTQAQYAGEDPILAGTVRPFPVAFLGSDVTEVAQSEFVPMPGGPTGIYHTCFTVRRTGGAGGFDVLTGTYDERAFPPTFIRTNEVEALNGPGDEFAATFSNDLLVFAVDTPSGPGFSVRTDTSSAFGALLPIGAPVPSSYVDSKLCSLDGVESYVFVSGIDVWAADFDRTAYGRTANPISNARRIVACPAWAVALHAPEAMRDATGATRAFVVAAQPAAGPWSAAFASSIHDRDQVRRLYQSADQLGHAAAIGGSTVWATKTAAGYIDPQKIDAVFVNSDRAAASGGTLHLTVWTPYRFFGPPLTATVAVGTLATSGASIPGIFGKLGLASDVFLLPSISVPARTGLASWSLPIPAVPAGISASVQGVMIDPATSQVYLANNGVLETY